MLDNRTYQTDNVAEYCREKGIDRSYLYQLRREHQEGATSTWEARKPGRPARQREEVSLDRVKELEHRCESLEEELDDAKFEIALAGIMVDELDRLGVLNDKRIKKKLPKPALDLLSEMQLRVSLARELNSQVD